MPALTIVLNYHEIKAQNKSKDLKKLYDNRESLKVRQQNLGKKQFKKQTNHCRNDKLAWQVHKYWKQVSSTLWDTRNYFKILNN